MRQLLLLLVAAVGVLPGAVRADVLRVPSEHLTIAEALSVASLGDTVLVAQGVYRERGLQMKSGVILTSESGLADGATIDAEYLGQIMRCTLLSDATTIRGFTFTHGLSGYDNGGAVNCNESDVLFENVAFRANRTYGQGGAVYCFRGTLVFRNVTFVGNGAYLEGDGGAIYCERSSPTIYDAVFEGNAGTNGGAIATYTGCYPVVANSQFLGNSATQNGGAVAVLSLTGGTFEAVLFADNVAESEGGAVYTCGNPTFNTAEFLRNSAVNGGALACLSSEPHIASSTFYSNAASGKGGGVYCNQANPWLARTVVSFSSDGEGLFGESVSSPVLVCCDIFGNADGEYGGAIPDFTGVGGTFSADPLFCDSASGDLTLDASSPCAPGNNGCDELIGANSVACGGATAVENTSWGRLKALYR